MLHAGLDLLGMGLEERLLLKDIRVLPRLWSPLGGGPGWGSVCPSISTPCLLDTYAAAIAAALIQPS
jgi:cytochrome c biogenesis protein CcdA